MISERQKADSAFENIKATVKESNLAYFINESPFSVTIKLKKRFMNDYSLKKSRQDSSPEAQQNLQSSPRVHYRDRGFQSQTQVCQSCDSNKNEVLNVRKELVEHNERVNELENTAKNKDVELRKLENKARETNDVNSKLNSEIGKLNSKIEKLNSEMDTLKDTSNNIKKDLIVKIEQLKQKNKSFDDLKTKYEISSKEKETIKNNFSNKISKLENKINLLTEVNQQKSKNLKIEQRKSKKLEDENQRNKNSHKKISKECQTSSKEFSSIATQTSLSSTLPEKISSGSTNSTLEACSDDPVCDSLKSKSSTINSITTVQSEVSGESLNSNSSAAAAFNLTKDIAGFFSATFSLDQKGEEDVLKQLRLLDLTEYLTPNSSALNAQQRKFRSHLKSNNYRSSDVL